MLTRPRTQAFIDARYKDGRTLTEDQITGMLIAVLFAGQHTSSITSTWTGLFLMADKTWYKKCCDEQLAVRAKNGAELNYEVLAQMDTLHVCIKEALRLHPPLIMLMRLAHEDFSVTDKDGRTYTVPKGDIVATSPTFSHRLEHVWTDANTYNPARHQPGSTDGQKPFSFVGFGGGRHGCMGETFAYMQIKTIWSVLLRSYDFDIVSPFPEPDYDSMVVRTRALAARAFLQPRSPDAFATLCSPGGTQAAVHCALQAAGVVSELGCTRTRLNRPSCVGAFARLQLPPPQQTQPPPSPPRQGRLRQLLRPRSAATPSWRTGHLS